MGKLFLAITLMFSILTLPFRALSGEQGPFQFKFTSPGSETEIPATIDRKTDLFVQLKGLDAKLPLTLEIDLRPLGTDAQSNLKNESVFQKKFKPGKRNSVHPDGSFTFRKNLIFQGEKETQWVATLRWSQSHSNATEIDRNNSKPFLSASIQALRNKKHKFSSEIGNPICYREGPLEISSEYLYNSSSQILTFTLTDVLGEQHQIVRDAGIGIFPGVGMSALWAVGEYTSFTGYQYAWLGYINTHISSESSRKSIVRSWKLNPKEGGIWGRRPIYSRFFAKDFSLETDSKTGQLYWKETGEGLLDREITAIEFCSVPLERSHSRGDLASYIEKARPLVNTCLAQSKDKEE